MPDLIDRPGMPVILPQHVDGVYALDQPRHHPVVQTGKAFASLPRSDFLKHQPQQFINVVGAGMDLPFMGIDNLFHPFHPVQHHRGHLRGMPCNA